jgi:hypothetical protein
LNDFLPELSNLSVENLDKFMCFYSQDCKFSDPFHSMFGKKNIKKVYSSMFENLTDPRFYEFRTISSESEIVIKWVFSFKKSTNSIETKIPGTSWLTLDNKNLISIHEDFWDGSEFFACYAPFNLAINWAKSKVKKNLY